MNSLPIDSILPQLLESISNNPNILLHAPPGAGKTTRVPLELLNIIPPLAGRILMLEPRRLAAVSAARWMARVLGEDVGRTVGYSIRFERCVSAATRIEVVTEGILTRRVQSDPLLEGVAMVIFDEFHERSIHADLGLALCLDVQRQVRDDLKILVMSATLDCEPLARLMDDAPVISSAGRSFPVREIFLDDHSHGQLAPRMVAAIQRALAESPGDILAFLPGAGEIRSCASLLSAAGLEGQGVVVHPLYGDLPFTEQQAAIQPGKRRKVVLATSIAETSLTIEGVRVVIDCGLSRRLRHDPANGMNRLVTVRESRSSALQRTGRAGRVADGVCYRMYSRHTFNAMIPQTPPEILDTDLSPLLLELSAWGVSDPGGLAWLDPPPAAALAVALHLLIDLGALDQTGRISPLGRSMARLPVHPRLGRLLERSRELGCTELGCLLAALLSERDPVRRGPANGHGSGLILDVHDRVALLRQWSATGRADPGVDVASLRAVERVSRQLKRLMGVPADISSNAADPETVCRLLISAYPDRVALRREGESQRYLLANGRGARRAVAGPVCVGSLLIAVSVDGGDQAEGLIHLSQEVTEELVREELGGRIERRDSITWDSREGRVVAAREEYLGALRLSSSVFVPAQEQLLPVVLEAVRCSGLDLLSRGESFLQLRARIEMLRTCFPDQGWPDYSDGALLENLESWLASSLIGVRNARQLGELNLAEILLSRLDYRQRSALDGLAPTHLVVPSGSRIRLDYCQGEQPVLAVKLQELFGLAQTPTVAGGRAPLLLHLLSPAGRPLQVTADLKGFWDGSYHQVKKEMKGRYPKHPWPDDPWSALPTRRTKVKG
ncbi:MAG: ATP-dependent helicase HrpB [Desulfuromonadales bacterium]|nr:ATP-dependent helicase HrpB [Desulfuromonadales bacterium]